MVQLRRREEQAQQNSDRKKNVSLDNFGVFCFLDNIILQHFTPLSSKTFFLKKDENVLINLQHCCKTVKRDDHFKF